MNRLIVSCRNFHHRSEIDEALANIRENEENDNVCDQVPRDSPGRTDNELASGGENYDLAEDLGIPSSPVLELNRVCNEMSNDEYLRTARSLNNEQLAFFYHILHLLSSNEC